MQIFNQKLIIMLLLLTAFAGRIAVYGFSFPIKSQELLKNISTDKSESSEKENQPEEKVKVADAIVPDLLVAYQRNSYLTRKNCFIDIFNLTFCHLSILGEPPKRLVF